MNTYTEALTALADPTRRAVFERLRSRPAAVGEIAEGMPVSRPAVSQHLAVLKRAGLVRADAIGTRRVYRVDRRGLEALRAYVDAFWDEALANYAVAAEATHIAENAGAGRSAPASRTEEEGA